MFWKSSLLTCSIAAVATLCLIFTGLENPGPSVVAVVLVASVVTVIMVGPYLAFGALAFVLRSHRIISMVLFVIILLVSMSALIAPCLICDECTECSAKPDVYQFCTHFAT